MLCERCIHGIHYKDSSEERPSDGGPSGMNAWAFLFSEARAIACGPSTSTVKRLKKVYKLEGQAPFQSLLDDNCFTPPIRLCRELHAVYTDVLSFRTVSPPPPKGHLAFFSSRRHFVRRGGIIKHMLCFRISCCCTDVVGCVLYASTKACTVTKPRQQSVLPRRH